MPTSISHLGGRARVNEPGRYRKNNNKKHKAQGLPTFIGMPQPLRNSIAKRVKPSQAVAKKKKRRSIQCTNCQGAAAGAAVTLAAGSSIEGTVKTNCAPIFGNTNIGYAISNNSSYVAKWAADTAANPLAANYSDEQLCCLVLGGEEISGCPPSGMYFEMIYDPDSAKKIYVEITGVAQNNYAAGTQPTKYEISVDRASFPGPKVITKPLEPEDLTDVTGDYYTAGDLSNHALEAAAQGDPAVNNSGSVTPSKWSFADAGIPNTILDGDTITVTFST